VVRTWTNGPLTLSHLTISHGRGSGHSLNRPTYPPPLEALCDDVLDILGPSDRDDDIALLAARFDGIAPSDVAYWFLEPEDAAPGEPVDQAAGGDAAVDRQGGVVRAFSARDQRQGPGPPHMIRRKARDRMGAYLARDLQSAYWISRILRTFAFDQVLRWACV
jgi:hypothetical protein